MANNSLGWKYDPENPDEKIPQDNFLALIIIGGTESANEKFDYLKNEMNLIKKFTEQNKPVLGICLGSQLIAKTFGAKVFPGPKKKLAFTMIYK